MISPQQAQEIIAHCTLKLNSESVSLEHALNRVLAEDLITDHDLPPFDRVMMDGIAVAFNAIEAGLSSFTLEGIQRAGEPQKQLQNANHALEVMTGTVCPLGADTVIPYEHLTITNGIAHVHEVPTKKGKNIHHRAADKTAGDCLASAGLRIGPAEIGIAASIGKTEIQVQCLPRIAICSTGDELVPITDIPLAHQIRRSNVYALQALTQTQGIKSDILHLPDDAQALTLELEKLIRAYDIILLSGGVSKGKFDLIPDVLESLGVDCLFHRIAQKPGKPMWFGRNARCVVFAFPGNPVSTMACAARYFLPWLKRELSIPLQSIQVLPSKPINAHASLTLFEPVKLELNESGIVAHPAAHNGSGDFSALAGANGFMEIPPENDSKKKGSRFRFYPLS
jgi:molybdopterin molybdotransferase